MEEVTKPPALAKLGYLTTSRKLEPAHLAWAQGLAQEPTRAGFLLALPNVVVMLVVALGLHFLGESAWAWFIAASVPAVLAIGTFYAPVRQPRVARLLRVK